MSFIGVSGILLLLVFALLFFGAKRLPLLARSAKVGAKELKDAASGVSGLSSVVPAEPAPLPPPAPARTPAVPDAD